MARNTSGLAALAAGLLIGALLPALCEARRPVSLGRHIRDSPANVTPARAPFATDWIRLCG